MIVGERVRLRAVEKEDLPRFVAWLNDPEVCQGLSLYIPLSMKQEEDWFESTRKRALVEQPLVIEVKSENGWTPVGNLDFHNFDWHERSSEFGIFIGDKRFWSQGYGQEAVRLLLRYGFQDVNLHRIYLRVFETNKRAIRAYERCGFVHEGRMRQAHYENGRYIDVLFMSVLRPEWDELSVK
jgi:RimJ/RimL family protein N-acetyltransferase